MTLLTVNYITNNYDYIQVALASMFEKTQSDMIVNVIINGPTDDLRLQNLATEFPQANIIQNDEMLGFVANHNRAMETCTTPYIALLNDDIRFENDALSILTQYLEQREHVGVVGPQLLNDDGTLQVSSYSDPTVWRMAYKISGLAKLTRQDGWLRPILLKLGVGKVFKTDSLQTNHNTREVDIIKGAFMVTRRPAYEQAGMMDDVLTILYGEEIEWHYRMRLHGWVNVLVPQAIVTHFGKGQMSLSMTGKRLFADRNAILNWFLKHGTPQEAKRIRQIIIVSHSIYATFWSAFDQEKSKTHREIVDMAKQFNREPYTVQTSNSATTS